MKNKFFILYYYIKYKFSYAQKNRVNIEEIQAKKINKHLKKIEKEIPFYQKYKDKALKEFPIMDKQTFMEHFALLNRVGMTEDEAITFAIASERKRVFDKKRNGITIGLSSGTSGKRSAFLVSNRENSMWAGYILSHVLPRGILHPCSIAFFMRANSNLYEAVGSKKIKFVFFDIFQDMEQHLVNLNHMQPNLIVGQPSVLLALAEAAKEGRLAVKPEKIISIAEVLEEQDADKIKSAFGLPLIHQVYQCTEGCLGITCRCGNLHLNEDIVSIEKDYIDENRFVPIITDFTRRTQPILRYRLNDILQENKAPCPCGSHFTRIEKIEGREDDVFLFQGIQEGLSVSVFPDFLRRCILFSGQISNYRMVQQYNADLQIYADATEMEQQKIKEELVRLAAEKQFLLPNIIFLPYTFDKIRKLKRVERQRWE